MPNFGFATISIIPSFKGIDVRARAGLGVLTKIGKDIGEETGKKFTRALEDKADPKLDLTEAGRKAGSSLAAGAESVAAPDMTPKGKASGESFTSGFKSTLLPKKSSEDMGSSFADSFKKAAVAGVLVAGAVVGAAFLNHLDKELSSDKLGAQLGGSEWAMGLGKVAGALYVQGFGESTADTGAIVRGIAQYGLLPEDATNAQIEALSAKALTFVDVLDQDVNPTIRAVATLLRTGMVASGEEAFDLLTRGIQQGADLGEDLLDTLNEYPTLFRDLGIDGKQGLGLISQGLKAGARNSDIMGDALKEFAIRSKVVADSGPGFKALGLSAGKMTEVFARGGKPAADALDLVLDRLRVMPASVEKNNALFSLFGTQSEDLAQALLAMDLTSAAAQLGDVAGATDDLGTAYDNTKSKIETFKREALEKATIFIEEQVIPKLSDMKTWVDNNETAVKLFAIAVGTTAVVALAAYTVAAGLAAAATIAATWPFILAGLAIAGLVVLFKHLYENNETFKAGIDGTIQLLRDLYEFAIAAAEAIGELRTQMKSFGTATRGAEIKIPGLPGFQLPDVPGIPWFDSGGVMPGRKGVHSLAMVAGGETVVPTHQSGWESAALAPLPDSHRGEGLAVESVVRFEGTDSGIMGAIVGYLRKNKGTAKAMRSSIAA